MQWKPDSLIATGEVLYSFFGGKVPIAVSLGDKILRYWKAPGGLDFGFIEGEQLKEGTIMHRSLTLRQRQAAVVLKENSKFGFSYTSTATPIKDDDGSVVGVIAYGMPLDKQDKLTEMAEQLDSVIQTIGSGSSEFASSSEQLAATTTELASNTEKIRDDVNNMDTIISFIMDIASQTHLLGLNAAIEAARAGDAGRGFNVVAEEIRKLAGRTQTSGKEVTAKLTRIKNNIDALAEKVLQVSAVSQQQASTSEEINASIQEMEPMTKELLALAAELVE